MTHQKSDRAVMFCDGASSGNPGEAGIGVVLIIGEKKHRISEYIGRATNNIAEYMAILRGITEAKRRGIHIIEINTDSELLVKQIKGQYRVKSSNLIGLYNRTISLLEDFESYTIRHIPREKNTEADTLAKKAVRQDNSLD